MSPYRLPLIDLDTQVKPAETHPYIHIYKWRLQQEHNMKATNGGRGMTDSQVEAYVLRVISSQASVIIIFIQIH